VSVAEVHEQRWRLNALQSPFWSNSLSFTDCMTVDDTVTIDQVRSKNMTAEK